MKLYVIMFAFLYATFAGMGHILFKFIYNPAYLENLCMVL
jgi:hypothetical protein